MGGFMQPQAHVQHVINLLKHGLDPQASCDMPRIRIGESYGGDGSRDGIVAVEPGFSEKTLNDLREKGHVVEEVNNSGRGGFGRAQILVKTDTGVLWGGSDPRADGCSMGY